MGRRITQLLLSVAAIMVILMSVVILQQYMVDDGNNVGEEDDPLKERPMIAISIDSMVIERWHRDVDIFKAKAEELGFQVEVVNAYEDSDKQIEQLRALIKEGAVALVVLPHDKDALADVVDEAKREGVVVLAYDRLIANADVDAYVSFDNVGVGAYMATALVEEVPEGNYVIINGAPKDNNSKMFNEGFYQVLRPRIDAGDITIIDEVWALNWREDFAYNTITRLLQEGETIDAIICANDLLAEGAISVLAEYGLVGEIPVVGHDADVSACQRIVEGKQLMTVYKPLKNLAEGAVEVVYELLHESALDFDSTINDGSHEVPYIKFDVIPVNSDNMRETIIKDFFHTEEDVYRNSPSN